MDEKHAGCIKHSAAGCGCLLLAVIAMPVVMAVMVLAPMNRAVASRAELEADFGTQATYTPPASGVPTAERIVLFLEVRRTLEPACEDFWEAEQAVARLEALDDQKEDVSAPVALKTAFAAMRPMLGMGTLISHFYETRNQALVNAGMGLGEYTYIYVLAYQNEILDPSYDLQVLGPDTTNKRVRDALRSMIRNQLDELERIEGPEEDVARLTAELEALDEDARRIPWQDGLPPTIEGAFLPYRLELDELFCLATSPLELMINEKNGPAIETR